jgi:hypothetical protein
MGVHLRQRKQGTRLVSREDAEPKARTTIGLVIPDCYIVNIEQSSEIWYFFPFQGIVVTDQEFGLQNPLFGDSTIISEEHYSRILDEASPYNFPVGSENIIKNPAFEDGLHSLIAVRRKTKTYVDHGRESARNRARKISSVLSIALLVQQEIMKTCGLLERAYSKYPVVINMEGNFFGYSIERDDSLIVRSKEDAFRVSGKDIVKLLNSHVCEPLYSAVLANKNLQKSLIYSIEQSCIRLSQAFYETTHSPRILGCITSIEILLSRQAERNDLIKNRIKTLIGDNLAHKYEMEKIFELRNKYVHKGEEIKDYEASTCSLALAMCCLFNYASLAKRFKSKEALIDFLDYLFASKKSILNGCQNPRFYTNML